MKWFVHNSLSNDDMKHLAGTRLMERLVRNRLIITYVPNDKQASYHELGLTGCEGLYHTRTLEKNVLEILFEQFTDLKCIEQQLTLYKMSVNN